MADAAQEWTPEGIDRLLAFRDVFVDGEFVPFTWEPMRKKMIEGKEVSTLPYPIYNEIVDQFWREFGASGGFIHPYEPLPEDPTQEGIPFSVLGAYFPIEYFETATVNQVRRYLSLCRRGERFCDGYIASQFETGKIVAALRRLRELRKTMP